MKKKLFALLSLAAGAAIVGTTFAAWAVTDNADPFSIKVTPGGSGTDDTKTVTLAYGSTFHANNISGLTAGTPKMAAEVGLLAETAGDAYEGKFSLELEDLTTGKPAGDAKLIDNLQVKVYSKTSTFTIEYNASSKEVTTDLTSAVVDCFIPTSGEHPFETSVNYTVPDGQEHVVYVVVSLASGLAPNVLDQIHDDYVRITMDWGKGSSADEESSEIYFESTTLTGEAKYYVYAWNSVTGNKNDNWPGKEMTAVYEVVPGTSLYSYNLGTQFDRVIFNDGGSGEGHESAAQTINSSIRESSPCFNGSSWIAKPAQSGLTAEWYLVGDYTGAHWDPHADGAMILDNSGSEPFYEKTGVVLAVGNKIKVCNAAKSQWRTSNDYTGANAHIDGEGNIVMDEAGTFNIRMYPSGTNGNFVILSKVS